MTFHAFQHGTTCGVPIANEWCLQKYAHVHGRACDSTCPCVNPANEPNPTPTEPF